MLPHPPRHPLRIARHRRLALYLVFALLLATGVAWLLLRFALPEPEQMTALSAWSMKAHGAAAMVVTFLVGTIWSTHIRHAWLRRKNRLAGSAFGAALLALVATGYGLYYFNGDALRNVTEWLHWIGGLALGLLFWWHRVTGRRTGVTR